MLGRETLNLYGQPRMRLSKWFTDTVWNVQLELSRATLFANNQDRQFDAYTPAGRSFQIYISSPEMAVLEWLFGVTDQQLFSDGVVDSLGLDLLGFDELTPCMRPAPGVGDARNVAVSLALVLPETASHSDNANWPG